MTPDRTTQGDDGGRIGALPTARAATASRPSPAVLGQAGIANAEDALRGLIRFLEADSGSTKAVLRAAEFAGTALPPEPDQPLESVVFWATDFGIYGKVSITRFNGKSGCGATKSPHRKTVRSGLKGADRDQR